MKKNYYIKIIYDGTDFNGWQAQKDGELRTVQEVLQAVAEQVFHSPDVKITASGRTDAGVHALGQVATFMADTTIPAEKLADCFNRLLPPDVKISSSGECPDNFDACRSAKQKTYVYTVYTDAKENPLKERYAVRFSSPIDHEKLLAAAKMLEGKHDFKAFCAANSSVKTTVRTVYEVKIQREKTFNSEEIKFFVTGNGFLYNMVRTMVGTLLDIATGRKTLDSLGKALEQGDRNAVGRTMPAKGLCLLQVNYSELEI